MSLKNPINAYFCLECGAGIVTVDRDEGVTPAMMGCRATPGCRGMSQSCWYRPPKGAPAPTFEWYRPTDEEAMAAGPAMYEHHKSGGLFIRPITGAEVRAKEGDGT